MLDEAVIQDEYDSGLSIRDLCKRYNVPHSKLKFLKTRNKSSAAKICKSIKPITEDGKKRLSTLAKENSLGGYRPHPNRGQFYNGVWFDSKWEVIVAKSLDENGVKWSRPRVGHVWTDCGKKYYPDFYLEEYDVYLDPKNPYLQHLDKTKIEEAQRRNNIRVIVLDGDCLTWDKIAPLV